jgi:putative holliday junction resolvase
MSSVTNNELSKIPLGRILCIDYGTKRVGLAMSDPGQILASSYDTLTPKNKNNLANSLTEIISAQSIVAVIVGMPYNMNGTLSDRTKEVKEFANNLGKLIDLPLIEWDERWSSVSAEKMLIETGQSPSRNKKRVDQVAAAFILQAFLDRLANYKRQTA